MFYLNDANMNVTCLVGIDGEALERYVYEPYGNVTIYDGSWGSRGSSSYDNSLLYCGYYHDNETGLYHVRNRYYHPLLGRWLQRDPAGYVDGVSLYEFCKGSALIAIDPDGLKGYKVGDVKRTSEAVVAKAGVYKGLGRGAEIQVTVKYWDCCTDDGALIEERWFWFGLQGKVHAGVGAGGQLGGLAVLDGNVLYKICGIEVPIELGTESTDCARVPTRLTWEEEARVGMQHRLQLGGKPIGGEGYIDADVGLYTSGWYDFEEVSLAFRPSILSPLSYVRRRLGQTASSTSLTPYNSFISLVGCLCFAGRAFS
jgi:RHS repeat-associated protein